MTLIPVSLRISNGALALLIVGSLVALLLGIYAWQAWKGRGKPKIERRGTLNLGDQLFDGWAASPYDIDPTPGTFSLYGRKDPNAVPEEHPEDPRKR